MSLILRLRSLPKSQGGENSKQTYNEIENILEAGLVMNRAPINSEGLVGTYPQIPPQTAVLVDHGAMFRQHRRMRRALHCGCSRTGRETVVVMRVVVIGTVEMRGEVVMRVVIGVGVTLISVEVVVSVAVYRVSVAVI
jgi:hypothetical protein